MTNFSDVSRVCPSGKISCSVPDDSLIWTGSYGDGNLLPTLAISATFPPQTALDGSIQFEFISTVDSPKLCTTATARINNIPDQQAIQGLKLTCTTTGQVSSSTLVDIKGWFTSNLFISSQNRLL